MYDFDDQDFLHSFRSLTKTDASDNERKDVKFASSTSGGGGDSMLAWGDGGPPGSTGGCSNKPKTVKEYEEELIELRRDNYDLRMRIYLMEEQYECCNQSSLDQTSSKLPLSFAQLKNLHVTNTELKDEIAQLKKQLCEKEELILKAAAAVDALEKNQLEHLDKIKENAEKECEELKNTIAQLTQEVLELKDTKQPVGTGKSNDTGVGGNSSIFDDSNVMYAMAFGLPLPPGKAQALKTKQEQVGKIASLELQLAKLERDLNEESSKRLLSDEMIDKIRIDLKESEEKRKHLCEEMLRRDNDLSNAQRLIEDKCQTIAHLQQQLVALSNKSAKDSNCTENKLSRESDDKISISAFSEFQEDLNQLREQLKTQKLENIRLQGENMKAMKTIQGLVKQNKALTRDLENNVSSDVKGNKTEMVGESSYFNKDNKITELESEVSVLKEKLSAISFGNTQQETTPDIALLKLELESKNAEIENLNEELKKRTFNLQELVNKELWDKNREIEKLNLTCERKQGELNSLKQEINNKNEQLNKLQEDMKKIDLIKDFKFKENTVPNLPLGIIIDEKLKNELKLTVEDNNKLKKEIEALNKKLSNDDSLCYKIKEDCKRWKLTAEESEKNREELINACTLLTTRLEELSTFLESLLPSLGSKKRRMLQQAIDRSREMSRSFSFVDQSSLSLSIPLLPDVSQVDFCSGDETLGKIHEKVTSLATSEDEVSRLKNQVESLVERLKKKDESPDKGRNISIAGVWSLETEERLDEVTAGSLMDSLSEISEEDITCSPRSNKKVASVAIVAHSVGETTSLPPTLLSAPRVCLSESDGGWSEPDRIVSKERIGICDVASPKVTHSSEESSRSNKKASGKKARNEGLLELKRLSAKLDCLEQMNEALHAELQVLHRSNSSRLEENNVSLSKPNSPKSLRDLVNSRRKSLEKSFNMDAYYEIESNAKKTDIDVLSRKIQEMSVQLESSCRRCLELEDKCLYLESERQLIESKLDETINRLKQVESELELSLSAVKEKDNQLLEKQCALLEANNNNILLNAKLEAVTENINIKQDQLEKYEIELSEKDEKISDLCRELDELRKQSESFESQLKSKLESYQRQVEEAVSRRLETERKLIESYQHQTELRSKLDQEILRCKDLENQNKHDERNWRRRLSECESMRAEREAELRRKVDTAVLTTSEAVLERTRLANDKLKLQQELRSKESTHFSAMKEWERRVAELETLNSELEAAARCRWEVRQEPVGARSPVGPRSPTGVRSPNLLPRSSGNSAMSPPLSPRPLRLLSNPSSDYVSDQEHHFQVVSNNVWLSSNQGRCNNNSSPDLGIESDHHSLGLVGSSKLSSLETLPLPTPFSSANGDVNKLLAENEALKKHLIKTKRALADTLSQLTTANQKKWQVERAICKQIHKTHSVLQKARVNFEQENQPPQQS